MTIEEKDFEKLGAICDVLKAKFTNLTAKDLLGLGRRILSEIEAVDKRP